MSSQVKKNQFKVGIYDNTGVIINEVISKIGKDQVLCYTTSENMTISPYCINPLSNFDETSQIYYIYKEAKVLFFFCSENIILHIDSFDFNLFSYFMKALQVLVTNDIKTLLVISEIDLQVLLQMGNEDEKLQVRKLTSEGRLIINNKFSLKEYLQLIS